MTKKTIDAVTAATAETKSNNRLYKATRNIKIDYLNIAIAAGEEITLTDKLLAQLKNQIDTKVLVPANDYDGVIKAREKRLNERAKAAKEADAEKTVELARAAAQTKQQTVGIVG